MFWRVGTMPSTAVMCCCSRVNGAGVAGTEVAVGVDGPATEFDGAGCESGVVCGGLKVLAAGPGKAKFEEPPLELPGRASPNDWDCCCAWYVFCCCWYTFERPNVTWRGCRDMLWREARGDFLTLKWKVLLLLYSGQEIWKPLIFPRLLFVSFIIVQFWLCVQSTLRSLPITPVSTSYSTLCRFVLQRIDVLTVILLSDRPTLGAQEHSRSDVDRRWCLLILPWESSLTTSHQHFRTHRAIFWIVQNVHWRCPLSSWSP